MRSTCHCILVLLIVFINVVLISSDDVKNVDDIKDLTGRALKDDFRNDQWRAVDDHQIENGGWKAAEEANEGVPQKRRRLRKRKRRPQIVDGEVQTYEGRPRRRRPVRLDENREVWKDMESEDAPKRPYIRRRTSPIYQLEQPAEQVQGTVSASLKFGGDSEENVSYDKIRDPYIAFQEAEEKIRRKKLQTTTNAPTTLHDLKSILKQSGGRLNLSELLQQRNLSLSDLLKGKQQAISVLTEDKPEIKDVISEYKNPTEIITNNTPQVALKENEGVKKPMVNRIYEADNDSIESGVNKDGLLEEQRNRFANLYRNQENKIYSDANKYVVVTEATTEKRIFVPSHPSFYTNLNFKPEIETTTPEMTTITPTTTETIIIASQDNIINKSSIRPKMNELPVTHFPPKSKLPTTSAKLINIKPKLPITSAHLHKIVKQPHEVENYPKLPPIPINAIKIDINELLGKRKEMQEDDGPLKMSFNLDDLVQETTIEPITTDVTLIENIIITERITTSVTSSVTTKKMQAKLRTVSAKDEIMEILKDEETKDTLSKILELRNMTVDQLVEQRERGSSQRHLADIFHNNTREPEAKEEHVGEVVTQSTTGLLGKLKTVSPTDNGRNKMLHEIDRKPKSTPVIELEGIDIKNIPDLSEELITSERIPGTSFPTYKIGTHKQEPLPHNVPIWKTIYPSIFNEPVLQKDDTYQREMQKIDEIENTVAKAVNEDYDEMNNKNNNDYDDYVKLPIGVKSAIFASLAIIGMSLLVFLTILVIFKWTQKHKKRLGYSGSFASKIKSPILDGDPKRTFRAMMHETLGRKKGYYKSHMQSMSDPWDSDAKPYQ